MGLRARVLSGSEHGQVLAIVAGGMVVIVAMIGLVIDGGYAWSQQRETQNGADSVAKAGTVVIQQYLAGGSETGGDVGCAVELAATENRVDLEKAVYTDHEGIVLSPEIIVPDCGLDAAIPSGAQGIKGMAFRQFNTYLMRVIGFGRMTSTADATAIVGTPAGICPASSGCAVLPVTVPYTTVTCDGQNRQIIGQGEWQVLNEADGDVLTAANEALIPLCATEDGSVGWLDYGCASTLEEMIEDPCNVDIPIPSWLHTQTGNPNNLEDELDEYTGPTVGLAEEEDAVLLVPIHDNTCRVPNNVDPPADDDDTCEPIDEEWSGGGNLTWYHVPYWQGFKLDAAYTGGNDDECNQPPGVPAGGGNGATGCLKGWFVSRVTSPGSVSTGRIERGDAVPMEVALIR